MTKYFRKMAALLLALCLVTFFSACTKGGNTEYKRDQSFEYHFYPEEYEEKYSKAAETLAIAADTKYQLKIEASCQSGTMDVRISYSNFEKSYSVDASAPLNDTLDIPAGSAGAVEAVVSIEAETEGSIVGTLLVAD